MEIIEVFMTRLIRINLTIMMIQIQRTSSTIANKLFKDQDFLTKITTSVMIPNLNPSANRKISLKGHLQAANLAILLGISKNSSKNIE